MAEALSQPGTVLPDSTFDAAKTAMLNRQDQQQAAQEKEKAKKEALKAISGLKIPEGGGEWDHVAFEKLTQDYVKGIGSALDGGGDPFDITTKDGQERMLKEAHLTEVGRHSRNAHQIYAEAVKLINSKPNDFAKDALDKWNEWIGMDLEQRMKTPPPENKAMFDYEGYKAARIKDVGISKKARTYQGGGVMGVKTEEVLSAEDLRQSAKLAAADAVVAEKVRDEFIPNMGEAGVIDLLARAKANQITPEEQWLRDDFELAAFEKETATISNQSEFSAGYAAKKRAAEYFVQQMKGFSTGDFTGGKLVKNPANVTAFGTSSTPASTEEPDAYIEYSSLNNFNFGPLAGEVISKVVLDPRKDKLALVASGNDSSDYKTLDWKSKDAFFAHLIPRLAEYNKEVDLGLILEELDRQGISWDNANVDFGGGTTPPVQGGTTPPVQGGAKTKEPKFNALTGK